MLPVDEVWIESVEMNDIRLGKSIYTKKQLDEFSAFQDSQGTRKAYLAKTAELAYMGSERERGVGLDLGSPGPVNPDRPHGYELHPPVLGGGTSYVFPVPAADGVGRSAAHRDDLPKGGHHCEVQGVWSVGVDHILVPPFPASSIPLQLDR